jgi:hypothetical protein
MVIPRGLLREMSEAIATSGGGCPICGRSSQGKSGKTPGLRGFEAGLGWTQKNQLNKSAS